MVPHLLIAIISNILKSKHLKTKKMYLFNSMSFVGLEFNFLISFDLEILNKKKF